MRSVRRIQWASEQQKQLFEAGPDPLLAIGGFNAAKTWGCILKLLRLLDLFPNSRAAIVRSSSRDMRKTTMETFYALCPPSAYSQGRRSDQEGICQLNNGSLVYFVHLDRPDSLNVLAGLELNFGFPDQAEQISERAWDTLDARLGRWSQAKIPDSLLAQYPEGWPWVDDFGNKIPPPFLFATANPPDSEEHWLYVRFAEESEEHERWKAEGYRHIRMPSYSNRFASQANLRKLRSKDPEFVRRYYEGLWSNPEGAIFDISPLSVLEPHPDLVRRIIDTMHLHRALDHGDSAPTCVGWFATDFDGNIFVYREHYLANTLVSDHRAIVHDLSKRDVPTHSAYLVPKYRSNIADPSIFSTSRGRTATSRPTWAISDEWADTRIMPRDTAIYWTRAPIPKSQDLSYDLITRSRVKEYLKIDPNHRHPITGILGAPRIYFLRKTDDYPNGCFNILKEIRGQRRKKIGEREGRSIYSEERIDDGSIPDHAYDMVKYFVISRPTPTRIVERVDPNVIDVRELMSWTARNARVRARAAGGY